MLVDMEFWPLKWNHSDLMVIEMEELRFDGNGTMVI